MNIQYDLSNLAYFSACNIAPNGPTFNLNQIKFDL